MYKSGAPHIAIRILPVTLSFLFLVFLLSGCLFPKEAEVLAPPLKEPDKIEYDLTTVKKGVFEKKVTCNGDLKSIDQKNMVFRNTQGRLKAIYAKLGDMVKKGDLLAELQPEGIDSQIKQEEITLKQYQMNYEEAKMAYSQAKMAYDAAIADDQSQYQIKNQDFNVKSADFNVKSAELNIEREKIKLEDLKRQLAATRLVAGISGTVCYISDIKEGQMVESTKVIVTIADPKALQVTYTGDEVSQFSLGKKVQLKVFGSEEIYKGTVVMTPENVPADSTDPNASITMQIKPDKLPEDAKIGDSVEITLMLVRKENVITITKDLVHILGDRNYVHVLENGVNKERNIVIGDEDDMQFLITQGLSAGDKLIAD